MITIDTQIHGYRKGHQLLASSVGLSKQDQSIIDSLSDVAGPLRPNERFEPYLTTYPLPSGDYYVVARTWQDLSVARAGCVRTKSLLINSDSLLRQIPLISMFNLLDSDGMPSEFDVLRFEVEVHPELYFPAVSTFNSTELIEAFFLEESKPIVMFDVPEPDWIALRLLFALWSDIHRRYAFSTFALSPRKIDGRDFDLVFAPSTAKLRFSDWGGRRLDGKIPQIESHRWTKSIARRVFEELIPSLLDKNNTVLFAGRKTDSLGGVRVALLWDELIEKLPQTPTAVLGLLDIVNSGMITSTDALTLLESRLVSAIRSVESAMSNKDAWDFLGAIVRKMKGHVMPQSMSAIEDLASYLAAHDPVGAFKLLRQIDPKSVISNLTKSIALGLSNSPWLLVKQLLINASENIIAYILSQNVNLAKQAAEDNDFIQVLSVVLTSVDPKVAHEAGLVILPFLLENRQLPVAIPIINRLNIQEIIFELHWLCSVNSFESKSICEALITRTHEVEGIDKIRNILVEYKSSKIADTLLSQTVVPVKTDILWILNENRLSELRTSYLLVDVLRRADDNQFEALMSAREIVERVVECIPDDTVDILIRIAQQDRLPIPFCIGIVHSILSKIDDNQKFNIAKIMMKRCLRNRFEGNEIETLSMLFGTMGERLVCKWVVKNGMDPKLDGGIVSRNVIAIENSPLAARKKIVEGIDEIALALESRYSLDLSEMANEACAKLMFDAEKTSQKALVRAADILLQPLFRARYLPVSSIVVALFPIVYQELARSDDVSESIKFIFPFFEWDRCKAIRKELVRIFMLSNWKAGDLALVACRCDDAFRIFEQVANSYGGEEYLIRVKNDLDRLDIYTRFYVAHLIDELISDK